MTTNWALPTTIVQYAEDSAELAHISWHEVDNFSAMKSRDSRFIKTSSDLYHIARDPKHDILQKTYYLKATGFNFENIPSVPVGIEVRLTMNRYGRVTDDTIQLCLSDTVIGDNLANLNLDPIKIYGSKSDMWNAQITQASIQNPTFGIVLRFKSHPRWPHRSSALIESVEIRVH